MDGELVRLTGTEWAVLDCLWEASPQTMTQLAHTLAGREVGHVHHHRAQADDRKGVAHLPAGGAGYGYAPAVERRAAVVSETRSFLRRICRESVSMLTNAAAEPERLSREEIDALYDVLKGLEEKEHG
ncbi:MAG: BlaI/MecI/CopY family transcriptional regulator [Flavonifractor plautii]